MDLLISYAERLKLAWLQAWESLARLALGCKWRGNLGEL